MTTDLQRTALMSLRRKRLAHRKMGVSLESVMLGVVVALFMLPQMTTMMKNSYDNNQDTIAGRQFETMADASRGYLNERYDTLRREFLLRANDPTFDSNTPLVMVLTPEDLALNGYLSRGYVTATADPVNYRNQSYRLIMRGVSVADAGFPQRTLTKDDIVSIGGPVSPEGNNELNDNVVDDTEGNDEMGIESILVTVGGEQIETVRAARIIATTESPVATDIRMYDDVMRALGAQGNFELPLGPWQDIALANGFEIEPGRLLSVVSLTGIGGGNGNEADMRQALLRCYDIPENTPEYTSCIQDGNNMYASIVFHDVPGRGKPGIYNLGNIDCRDPADPAMPYTPVDPDRLTINCETVVIGGDLTVRDVTARDIGARDISATNITAENVDTDVLSSDSILLNDNDISNHLIIGSGVVPVGETVPQPTPEELAMCPSGNLDVNYGVSGMIENVGRAISGYRPYVDESDDLARIIVFTNEDFCPTMAPGGVSPLGPMLAGLSEGDPDFEEFGFEPGTLSVANGVDGAGNPVYIYPNAQYTGVPRACLVGGVDTEVSSTLADGYPDAYWVGDGQGLVSYQFTCAPAPTP